MPGALLLLCAAAGAAFQPPRADATAQPKAFTAFDWWTSPIESNAIRRLPTIKATMNSIDFVDQKNGWAVGDSGTIVATVDGGLTWTAQTSGTTASLKSVTLTDPSHGWAVGNSGTILATVDGGLTWKAQTSGTTASLEAVTFTDTSHGWAIGDSGTILATSDGGLTWGAQSSGTDFALTSITFTDSSRGWTVSRGGAILATVDGGLTWRDQSSGHGGPLRSITFTDSSHGWAVGNIGAILATVDGGLTWGYQTGGEDRILNSITFTDPSHGWAVGHDGAILATVDGGLTWKDRSSGHGWPLRSITFTDSSHGWAVGDNGTILATVDGGLAWTAQTTGTSVALQSVSFTDSSHGWTISRGGAILATIDGGLTWKAQTSGTTASLESVTFTDSSHGWAVSREGTILATVNGGLTWNAQTSYTDRGLSSITFTDSSHGWAVGGARSIYATVDGGLRWMARTGGRGFALTSITFADSDHGWAVGDGGTILATFDGGLTWNDQTSGTLASLYSVTFTDPFHGCVVGGEGTILATIDGGRTWKEQSSGTKASLHSVTFTDSSHGWGVGDNGTILYTVDGGLAWVAQTTGTSAALQSVTFTDSSHGWAVGSLGTVLVTVDGGESWRSIDPFPYHRWPAPWCCVAALLGVVSIAVSFTPVRVASPTPTLVRRLLSDRPVAHPNEALGTLAERARGIAAFLRNADTAAPVTIAVTGEWGSGKSSLMSLVNRELKSFRFRPVWFNAWHHQSEPQLLGALLESIARQAVLPLWRPDGWPFRLRLLRHRGTKAGLLALALLLSLAASAGWIFAVGRAGVLEALENAASRDFDFARDGGSFGAVGALAATLLVLLRAACAFRLDPSEAATRLLSAASVRHPRKSTSFRERFKAEFGDVTKALAPQRMVLFLDDLDRCTPENVVTILETVNFLVSSGECFVVLGLARHQVEAAIGLAYTEMATELTAGRSAGDAEGDSKARRQRRLYAQRYLSKLIQLDVPVPRFDSAASAELLGGPTPPAPNEGLSDLARRAAELTARYLPWLFGLVLVAIAFALGTRLDGSDEESGGPPAAKVIDRPVREVPHFETQPAEVGPPQPYGPTNPRNERPEEAPNDRARPGAPTFVLGIDPPTSTLSLALLLAALVAASTTGAFVMTRRAQTIRRDPPEFAAALTKWREAIEREYPTPRDQKRFLNQLRLLHVLEDPPHPVRSEWERFSDWVQGRTPPRPAIRPFQLTELDIVRCGALAKWRDRSIARGAAFDAASVARRYRNVDRGEIEAAFEGDHAARWRRFDELMNEIRGPRRPKQRSPLSAPPTSPPPPSPYLS